MPNIIENPGVLDENKNGSKKNYCPVFWKFFWVAVVLNIIAAVFDTKTIDSLNPKTTEALVVGVVALLWLVANGIFIYKFCRIINEAMLSIGKKNWWPLGLLTVIPFGFWIAFFVVRSQLKPHSMWVPSKHKSFRLS